MTKTYPFSLAKNEHNLLLAYNILRNRIADNENDTAAWKAFNKLNEAWDEARACGSRVAWVSGKTYGILRDATAWAVNYRDAANGNR